MVVLWIILTIAGLIFFAEQIIPATVSSVTLCITSVVPSLFPFFVCVRMLLELHICESAGRLFDLPFKKLFALPSIFAGGFILGCLCGFPMGAKISASFYKSGQCDKHQAVLGAILCNNAGPLFIIGTLGTVLLHQTRVGQFLWLIHLASAIITTLLLKPFFHIHLNKACFPFKHERPKRFDLIFSTAVFDSIQTLLQVCGTIIFFNAATQTLICFGMPKNGLLIGCIEMTGGLSHLAKTQQQISLPLCSFLLGLGGLSVWMQVASAFSSAQLPLFPYIMGKIIQGSIAAALTALLQSYIPVFLPVFNERTLSYIPQNAFSLLWILSVLILITATLLTKQKRV